MNYQEIYDKVKNHLLTQNKKSKHLELERCLYRGPDNTSCAIGCLIPDDLYDLFPDEYSNGETIVTLLSHFPSLLDFLKIKSEKDKIFLTDLQNIHDFQNVPQWKVQLETLAKRNNLTP